MTATGDSTACEHPPNLCVAANRPDEGEEVQVVGESGLIGRVPL